jgi:hypothetical protein
MKHKVPSAVDFAEHFRTEILRGRSLIGVNAAHEELKRSRFFIETMEQFVSSSEGAEVKALEKSVSGLSAEAKDEFWQWHYPIHWEDIFGVRIRSAFVAQLCSHIEALLADIAHRVQVIERSSMLLKHLKGTALEQARLYYQAFGRFGPPDEELWAKMVHIFRIRNIHVHEQGYARELPDDKRFLAFLQSLPNVGIDHNFVELRAGSCAAILSIAEAFQASLLAEYEAYRQRSLAVEKMSRKDAV